MRRIATSLLPGIPGAATLGIFLLCLNVAPAFSADPPKDKNKRTFLDGQEAGLDYAL